MRRTLAATAASLVATPLCAVGFFIGAESLPDWARIAGLIALAPLLGLMLGALFGRDAFKPIGLGAFAGLLLIWTPLVLVTYGMALMGIPLLAAYAACVALGVRFSGTPSVQSDKSNP